VPRPGRSKPTGPPAAKQPGRCWSWLPCILALAVSACAGNGSSPVPTAPAAAAILRIEPAVTQVYRQGSVQLSAVLEFADGSRQSVNPQWSTYPVSVAFINSTGLLSGSGLGKVIVTAQSAEYRTGLELDVVRNPDGLDHTSLTGKWSGRYILDSCEHLSGPGPNSCWEGLPGEGPLQLDLLETTQWQLAGPLTVGSGLSGPLQGWRAGIYMFLAGALATEGGSVTAELVHWDVRLDNSFPNVPPFKSLTGRIVLAIQSATDRYLATCRLVDVERP
jgi:hypothetical protein